MVPRGLEKLLQVGTAVDMAMINPSAQGCKHRQDLNENCVPYASTHKDALIKVRFALSGSLLSTFRLVAQRFLSPCYGFTG
jgi:hypothetical protein